MRPPMSHLTGKGHFFDWEILNMMTNQPTIMTWQTQMRKGLEGTCVWSSHTTVIWYPTCVSQSLTQCPCYFRDHTCSSWESLTCARTDQDTTLSGMLQDATSKRNKDRACKIHGPWDLTELVYTKAASTSTSQPSPSVKIALFLMEHVG